MLLCMLPLHIFQRHYFPCNELLFVPTCVILSSGTSIQSVVRDKKALLSLCLKI